MAGRCRSADRLLAGATGRAILGVAAFSQDSTCTLAGRDGLPGTQRRTGIGPLRRTALAGLASPRNASEHGLCVLTHRASPGKKKLLVRCCRHYRRSERGYRSGSFSWRDNARGVKPALTTAHDT